MRFFQFNYKFEAGMEFIDWTLLNKDVPTFFWHHIIHRSEANQNQLQRHFFIHVLKRLKLKPFTAVLKVTLQFFRKFSPFFDMIDLFNGLESDPSEAVAEKAHVGRAEIFQR